MIATDIGAVAELVESGRTGLHFRSGDSVDLITQVEWALTHPQEWFKMRKQARAEFVSKYTAKENYQILQTVFALATASRS